MRDDDFKKRMRDSALDFWEGVRPTLQTQMNAHIFPVEMLQESALIKQLDQIGIDAFYMDRDGDVQGLASRLQWSAFAKTKPSFTFRYALWDAARQQWNRDGEYQRKLRNIKNTTQGKLFPAWHVESWSEEKGSGRIQWSYMAQTRDLMLYIERYLQENDKKKVYTFEPKTKERREVVVVNLDAFAKEHAVTEVKIKTRA